MIDREGLARVMDDADGGYSIKLIRLVDGEQTYADVVQEEVEKMKHTPGPWVYRPNEYDDWGTVRAVNLDEHGYRRHICKVNYVASPEELCEHRKNRTDPSEADARLIAAAPELLAALKLVTSHWASDYLPQGWEPIARTVIAAIAKATTESTPDV